MILIKGYPQELRKCLKNVSEISYEVSFGDGGTNKKKKEEAEQDDKIDFWPGQAQLRISVSEGQLRSSSLEKKGRDADMLDMCKRGSVNILHEGF